MAKINECFEKYVEVSTKILLKNILILILILMEEKSYGYIWNSPFCKKSWFVYWLFQGNRDNFEIISMQKGVAFCRKIFSAFTEQWWHAFKEN